MKCSALIHDNRCSQSVHSIVHDNRMFAERTFYCLNATQVEARRTDEKKPKGASGQMYQFFVEPSQIQGNRIVITGSDVNHIKNVLRMKPGEEIAVSNGTDGKEYRCGIEELLEEEIICTLRFIKEDGLELPARVTFFQGLPKADKMEFIVQKLVELGAAGALAVDRRSSSEAEQAPDCAGGWGSLHFKGSAGTDEADGFKTDSLRAFRRDDADEEADRKRSARSGNRRVYRSGGRF